MFSAPRSPWRRRTNAAAIALLREAVAIQDTLKYGEPPDWFYPVRESLGGALLMSGDSAGAEKVFREDLDRNPSEIRARSGDYIRPCCNRSATTMRDSCRNNSTHRGRVERKRSRWMIWSEEKFSARQGLAIASLFIFQPDLVGFCTPSAAGLSAQLPSKPSSHFFPQPAAKADFPDESKKSGSFDR